MPNDQNQTKNLAKEIFTFSITHLWLFFAATITQATYINNALLSQQCPSHGGLVITSHSTILRDWKRS